MYSRARTLPALIESIYDAAGDDARWPAFLESLARVLGGRSALLRSHAVDGHEVGYVATYGYDRAFLDAYCKHFVSVDPYRLSFTQVPVQKAFSSDAVAPLAERRKTEWHNDYERPQGIFSIAGFVIARNQNRLALLGVQRDRCKGEFGPSDLRLLDRLAQHLSRAFEFRRRIAELESRCAVTQAALDALSHGLVLLDQRGLAVMVNRAAHAILSEPGSGLTLRNDRVVLVSADDQARFGALVSGALEAPGPCGAPPGGALCIARGCRKPLQVLVSPLPRDGARFGHEAPTARVAVFFTSSTPTHLLLAPEVLVRRFGLTAAEAKVAARIARAESVGNIALSLGLSENTVRTQLKTIFQKTGVSRQAELAIRILGGAAEPGLSDSNW